ncbi:MAG: DUF5683 domain-containing protein [Bacteroidales bacterium]
MQLKSTILILLICFFIVQVRAQVVYNRAKEKATELSAQYIIDKIISESLDNEFEIQKITVAPVYNQDDKITEDGNYLAKKIVHQLNQQFPGKLNFAAEDFTEDPYLEAKFKEGMVVPGNESDYYKELLDKYDIDYMVTLYFTLDFGNNLILDNITINTNYFKPGVPKKQYPVKTVKVANSAGFAPIWRSGLVPGWGQLYKNQKGKGYVMLAGTGALWGCIAYTQFKYIQNYNDAQLYKGSNNDYYLTYKENYEKWEKRRNTFLIGYSVYWALNIVDVVVSKPKKSSSYISSIHLSPAIQSNYYTMNVKFNLK